MGKDRAQQIIKEKEYECASMGITTSDISYKTTLHLHMSTQIEKLKNAYLSVCGWKLIVDNYDPQDTFTDYSIFDIPLKAFYLQKLYSMSLKHYDHMSNFNGIAQIALVEANQHLGVTGSESGELSMHYIKHPKTLLNWF